MTATTLKERWHNATVHCLLLLVFLAWDPLGLATLGEQESRDTFLKLVAPFYPLKHQDDIVVVTISEEDLLARTGSVQWPPPYEFYNDLLTTLALWEPRGILFDIFLSEQRDHESTGELATTLRQWYASPTSRPPLIMGVYPPENINEFDTSDPAVRYIPGEQLHHELTTAIPSKAQGLLRWMRQNDAYNISHQPDSQRYYSAAAALYMADKERRGESNQAFLRAAEQRKTVEMSIIWGIGQPTTMPANANCFPATTGQRGLTQAAAMAWDILAPGLFPATAADRAVWRQPLDARCAFHPTLSANDVMQWPYGQPPQRRDLLSGRFILIGTNIENSPDRVNTPVYGPISGVHIHAMALDNLLNFDAAFLRVSPQYQIDLFGRQIQLSWDTLVEVVFALVILGWVKKPAPQSALTTWRALASSFLFHARQILFATLLLLVVISIYAYLLRYTPTNWITILLFLVVELMPDNSLWRATFKRFTSGKNRSRGYLAVSLVTITAITTAVIFPRLLLATLVSITIGNVLWRIARKPICFIYEKIKTHYLMSRITP